MLILTATRTLFARQAAALNTTSRITMAEDGWTVTLRVTKEMPGQKYDCKCNIHVNCF
jgi:hypothetical protein